MASARNRDWDPLPKGMATEVDILPKGIICLEITGCRDWLIGDLDQFKRYITLLIEAKAAAQLPNLEIIEFEALKLKWVGVTQAGDHCERQEDVTLRPCGAFTSGERVELIRLAHMARDSGIELRMERGPYPKDGCVEEPDPFGLQNSPVTNLGH